MKSKIKHLILGVLTAAAIYGCTENVDKSNRYVFSIKTIVDYLESHEQYSEYLDLLSRVRVSSISETTLRQLLSARGNYTVFAPTNEAMQEFLNSACERGLIEYPAWDSISDLHVRDSLEKVAAYNSIIDGGDNTTYETEEFPVRQGGEIPIPNMYDRRLSVMRSTQGTGEIWVNDAEVDLRNRDIPLLNGVLHCVNSVIAPSNSTLGDLLLNTFNEKREGFYVASMMVNECGLVDTLQKYKDFEYEKLVEQGIVKGVDPYPKQRYYGFTLFAETDSFWQETLGRPALEIGPSDIVKFLTDKGLYPDARNDEDYKSTDNILNRFITYHLIPVRISPDRLVYHRNEFGYNLATKSLGAAMADYFTTMGHRRLLKVFESRESKGIYLNRFPVLNDGRRGDYHEKECAPELEGILIGQPNLEGENNVRNGIIYPIEKLLVYDDLTRNSLQRQRIRWDVSAMLPELENNNYRMGAQDQTYLEVFAPPTHLYQYFDDLVEVGQDTRFYYRYFGYGNNYLHDEFLGKNIVDFTLRMPPVPRRGTYEVRLAVKMDAQGGAGRGIYQFYWGTDKERLAALGIPVNFRLKGDDIGWEADTEDEYYNAEIDKRMRNHDFMKGPALYSSARSWDGASRRIIVRQTMDPDKVYYLRFKSADDIYTRALYLDYMEYCSKEVYDNPERPEDIW